MLRNEKTVIFTPVFVKSVVGISHETLELEEEQFNSAELAITSWPLVVKEFVQNLDLNHNELPSISWKVSFTI